MKVLIIGYGSIGKRHYEILHSFKNINLIDIVTKQNIQNIKSYEELIDIRDLNLYDYFVISSETIKHHEQLKYICSKVNEKIILVEKPLYDKNYDDIKTTNQIFTAYNLRFHPILEKLKNLLENEDIYYANIICGQYLPTWRPEEDYRDSYSANVTLGGGVLRDLSHELDYATWLFGKIEKIDSINTKISDLDIMSDDIFTAIAVTNKKIIVNLSIDYISKVPMRRLIIHTKDNTIEADMINNILIVYHKDGYKKDIKIKKIDRNYTYMQMHKKVITNNNKIICTFEEAKYIMNIIESIEYREI